MRAELTELTEAISYLREMEDQHEIARARVEAGIIVDAGGAKALGSNQEERQRALTLAMADDQDYQAVREAWRAAQLRVDYAKNALTLNEREHSEAWRNAYMRYADAVERLYGAISGATQLAGAATAHTLADRLERQRWEITLQQAEVDPGLPDNDEPDIPF